MKNCVDHNKLFRRVCKMLMFYVQKYIQSIIMIFLFRHVTFGKNGRGYTILMLPWKSV